MSAKHPRHRFDPIYRRWAFDADIIELCVRWYITYRLSHQDLVEMMAERGAQVARSTILRWVTRSVQEFEKRWNRLSKAVGTSWRVDETYLSIKAKWHYLYRAVDKHGKTIDFLLRRDRCTAAAQGVVSRSSLRIPPQVTNAEQAHKANWSQGLDPNLRGISSFCAVPPQYPQKCADNPYMGFRFHRSVKLFPGLRLNFGKRGISTSIGVRGAHVTFGKSGTRTVGLPGSGLSYTHLEKPHRGIPTTTATETLTDPGAPVGSAQRGVLSMGLIVIAIVVAIGHVTAPALAQVSTPPQTVAQTAARLAHAAEVENLAETKRATRGVTQIRHAVANSNTLRLSRVTVMPNDTICYRLQLRNSRGVTYTRTAVMDGSALKTSGSDGFTALWNRLCAHESSGRDITSDVQKHGQ